MTNFSKLFYLKLFISLITIFIFFNAPVIAQDKEDSTLYNKPKAKILKSVRWKTPKIEKKETKEKAETPIEDKAVEELTEDQKLWKKYKDLAAGGQKKEIEDETEDETDGDLETKTSAKTTEKKEESSIGIQAIIENYKNANKNKGKMHSRSFGKID